MIDSIATNPHATWYLDAGMTATYQTSKEVFLAVPRCFQLDTFSCGLIAALVVVRHFEPDADLQPLANAIRANRKNGCGEPILIKALAHYGICVMHLEKPIFAAIDAELREGHPLIAAVRGRWTGIGHWAVIYGARRHDKRVYLVNDGIWNFANGSPFEAVEKRWDDDYPLLACQR